MDGCRRSPIAEFQHHQSAARVDMSPPKSFFNQTTSFPLFGGGGAEDH
jgi:hypothetical protein